MALFKRNKANKQEILNSFTISLESYLRSLPATNNPVYQAIKHQMASTIATLDVGLYRRTSSGRWVREYNHDVARLLKRPNPDTTQTQFQYVLADNFIEHNQAFIASKDRTFLDVIPSEYVTVSGNKYKKTFQINTSIPYTTPKMIHTWNPQYYDGMEGHSILEMNKDLFDLHNALLLYMKTYFGNSAGQHLAITLDEKLNDGLMDENIKTAFESWINEKVISASQAGRPLLLKPGMKAELLTQPSNAEAELASLLDRVEKQIACLLGFPYYRLSGEYGNNLANQQVAYLTSCILPITDILQEALTLLLDNPAYGRDKEYMEVHFTYDNLLMPDIDTQHKIVREDKRAGIITVDEAREVIGKPEYNGNPDSLADAVWADENQVPMLDDHRESYFNVPKTGAKE